MSEYRVMKRSVPHDGDFDVYEFVIQEKEHPSFEWYTLKQYTSETLVGAVRMCTRLQEPLVQVYP